MFFSLKKKKIKYSLVILMSSLVIGTIFVMFDDKDTIDEADLESDKFVSQVTADFEMNIKMITHYIVGEDVIENKTEQVKSLDELISNYSDWQMIDVSDNRIIFEREIEDLSPECKNGTYFSINPEGYLILFSGDVTNRSDEDKIIETFFRIDIQKLEGSLPVEPIKELYEGIPIKDSAEFNSVLSTFSEFTIE